MIRSLARLLAPLAAALLREPPVRHALIRALAEQEAEGQAVRERLLLTEQVRHGCSFSTWLASTNGDRREGQKTPETLELARLLLAASKRMGGD